MQQVINARKYNCRHCNHWHNMMSDVNLHILCPVKFTYEYGTGWQDCGCTNWESDDSLTYLENKYIEKSLNG